MFSWTAVQREPNFCTLWQHWAILYSWQLQISQQEYKANVILLFNGNNVRRTRHNSTFYYIAYLVFNIQKVSASTLVSEIGCPDWNLGFFLSSSGQSLGQYPNLSATAYFQVISNELLTNHYITWRYLDYELFTALLSTQYTEVSEANK
jgi:hypothetical protein